VVVVEIWGEIPPSREILEVYSELFGKTTRRIFLLQSSSDLR
jgi:hypothetical protein